MKDLLKECKVMVVQDPLTAGSTTNLLRSATVDMAGFNSCLFISTVGATTTLVTMAVDAGGTTTSSDSTGIASATANSTASNGAIMVNVLRTTQRYLTSVLTSTGTNVNGSTIAILYDATAAPTTNASTDVLTSANVVST